MLVIKNKILKCWHLSHSLFVVQIFNIAKPRKLLTVFNCSKPLKKQEVWFGEEKYHEFSLYILRCKPVYNGSLR